MRALALTAVLLAATAATAEEIAVPAAPGGQALTIYGGDISLVRDRRAVELREGANRLVFEGVSRAILPESVTLRAAGTGLRLVERAFDRDLLSAEALLARSIGREVWVQRPTDGAIERRRGVLRGVDEGLAIVEVEGRIELVDALAVAFDSVPAGIRAEPALVLEIEAGQAGAREIELGYLTQGLSWRADYVLELDPEAPRMNLDAVATVTNESGTAFHGASLAFVAGDVNRVPVPMPVPRALGMRDMRTAAAPEMMMAEPEMGREAMAAAHLYRLDRPADLPDRQTKQLSLLGAREVVIAREYVAPPLVQTFHQRFPRPQQSNATLELVFHNTEAARLGMPLPAGVARIYQRDAQGELRFQGEDRIGEVAVGEEVRLQVGRDFDLPVRRVQTEFRRVAEGVSESRHEVRLRNGKAEPVTVRVKEAIGGDWQILDESAPHKREAADLAVWQIAVPAGGEAVLTYSVRVRGY